MPGWLTTEETASILGYNTEYVRRLIRRGATACAQVWPHMACVSRFGRAFEVNTGPAIQNRIFQIRSTARVWIATPSTILIDHN